jgi:CDP-diacylglycerol--glycerol-3-phosphate 3-phosphatidyltransferase
MNLPNLITLSRIPLTFAVVLLIFGEWTGAATSAFVLFIVCGITDWLDGHLARKHGAVSNFGIFMDALTDKIAVLGVLVALTDARLILPHSRVIPVLMLLLILTRDFMVTGMRLMAAKEGVVVAAEKGGKFKTILQIVAISALLLVPTVERDLNHFLRADLSPVMPWLRWFAFGTYAVATFLTLDSGARYVLKYRHLFAEKKS